jgi:hypothetical protein
MFKAILKTGIHWCIRAAFPCESVGARWELEADSCPSSEGMATMPRVYAFGLDE